METLALALVLAAKVVADIAFGKKALDEVSKLRIAVEGTLDNHENRLKKLEA